MKKLLISMLCVFALCGCGQTDDATKGTENQSNETTPEKPSTTTTNSTIDDFMRYMKDSGVEYMDEQPLENMNITAHEGRSFTVNGQQGYLYRVDTSDDTMKKLMESAKTNGTVDATQDGVQKSYNAHVNGDYLYIYDKEADMSSIMNVFPNFDPTAPYTTNAANPSMNQTTVEE